MKSVRQIQEAVCREFSITFAQMLSPDRKRAFARPRQIAMFLAREFTALSYPDLGRAFCRDHCTVLHAIETVQNLDPAGAYAQSVHALREEINGGVPRHVEPIKLTRKIDERAMRREWKAQAKITTVAGGRR